MLCKQCGKEFEAIRKSAVFCKPYCRVQYNRNLISGVLPPIENKTGAALPIIKEPGNIVEDIDKIRFPKAAEEEDFDVEEKSEQFAKRIPNAYRDSKGQCQHKLLNCSYCFPDKNHAKA